MKTCTKCTKPEGEVEFSPNPKAKDRLEYRCVDHDHKTGKVRGLLCGRHNKAIGLLDDNVTYLAAAIQYLNKDAIDGFPWEIF